MRRVRQSAFIAMVAVSLVVAACAGNDEQPAAGGGSPQAPSSPAPAPQPASDAFNCRSVQFIVTHSPGGGSDQMVRRLQPHLEEFLGVTINVIYRTGGFSSVGLQSVHDAAPDGCTVSNAVYPDMALLTIGLPDEDTGFKVDGFTYLTWSESAPNVVYVDINSEWVTLDQMLDVARTTPGSLSFGGTGTVAQYVFGQITDATGVDLTYVPIEGGPSQIVPQILGGHLSMGVGGANHAAGTQRDNIKALAVAGPTRVPALPDVPTFEELGYSGVDVATVWGVIGPAGIPSDVVDHWNEALLFAIERVRSDLEERGYSVLGWSPDDSKSYALSVHADLRELLAK